MGYFLTSKKRLIINKPLIVKETSAQQVTPIVQASKKVHWFHELFPNAAWNKQSCVILGGGPSLAKISDFSFLNKHRSIAINKSFLLHPTTLIYSMDTRFYKWVTGNILDTHSKLPVHNLWNQSKSLKVFLEPSDSKIQDFADDVVFVKRLGEDRISPSLKDGIYGANNSLFGAVMLAITMGANPIYILGGDLKTSGTKTHWHNGYPEQKTIDLEKRLGSYADAFNKYASTMLKHTNIFMVGDSVLQCFQKCNLAVLR